jgi:tol-pal system protein YbgF
MNAQAKLGVAFAATFALTGCLASKGDVALLQSELRSMQDASTQADAARRQQLDRAIEQLLAQVGRTNDSIRVVSQRLAKLQGDVQTANYDMGRQILQIQELVGQSGKRMQELRAAFEERNQAAMASGVTGDTTHAAAGVPGEAQLYQNSVDQLRRGASGVARSGFQQLLQSYPNSDNAPDAMIYIASSYAAERNQVAADSVYDLVVQRYPKSPKAATALYKHGLSYKTAGQMTKAREAFNRVVREYPNSDEVELARDQLRSMGR